MKFSSKILLGLATSLALSTVSVSAASVDLVSVSGIWTDANPAGVTGEGTNLIQWGTPSGQPDQSGYLFDGAGASMNLLSNTDFDLGTFTHQNNPINGVVLSDAELTVSIGLSIDSGATEFVTAVFDFEHLETPNLPSSSNPDPSQTCANGLPNATGININGCADRVTATQNAAFSQSFVVDGDTYTFDFSGFLFNGDLLDEFWTRETVDNSAVLRARFTSVAAVPLPAAGLLMLAALGGLGLARRKT
jgi:hypothetical protein